MKEAMSRYIESFEKDRELLLDQVLRAAKEFCDGCGHTTRIFKEDSKGILSELRSLTFTMRSIHGDAIKVLLFILRYNPLGPIINIRGTSVGSYNEDVHDVSISLEYVIWKSGLYDKHLIPNMKKAIEMIEQLRYPLKYPENTLIHDVYYNTGGRFGLNLLHSRFPEASWIVIHALHSKTAHEFKKRPYSLEVHCGSLQGAGSSGTVLVISDDCYDVFVHAEAFGVLARLMEECLCELYPGSDIKVYQYHRRVTQPHGRPKGNDIQIVFQEELDTKKVREVRRKLARCMASKIELITQYIRNNYEKEKTNDGSTI